MKIEQGPLSLLVPPGTVERTPEETIALERPQGCESGIAQIKPTIYAALALLLDANSCAADVGADVWQFSVEITALLSAGLTTNECRWLVAKGLAKHAGETTTNEGDRRVFQPCANLALPQRACFVITDRGIVCATELLRSAPARQPGEARNSASSLPSVRPTVEETESEPTTPTWDSDRQQLRVGRIIVKEFKVPAANQEAILATFQEENWCPRIDDPLAPKLNQDSKRRLHDTINSLNRNQKHALVRFLGDGKGEGVRWRFVERRIPDHAAERFCEPR